MNAQATLAIIMEPAMEMKMAIIVLAEMALMETDVKLVSHLSRLVPYL